MYTEKDVIALLKAYKEDDDQTNPKDFLFKMDKESGWNKYEKKGALFETDELDDRVYIVRSEIALPVNSSKIGEKATDYEIRKEFTRQYPNVSRLMFKSESELKLLQIIKNGEILNKEYSGEIGREKSPSIKEPKEEGNHSEVDRLEVLAKKIRYDDGTSQTLTYDVTTGQANSTVDIPGMLDVLISSVSSLIRSSDNEAEYMKKTIEALNELFLDANSETKVKNV